MLIESEVEPYWRGIPSKSRSENVARTFVPESETLCGSETWGEFLYGPATWYVYDHEREDYEREAHDSGVRHLIDIKSRKQYGLSHGRNEILEDAFDLGVPCVMMDDDYDGTSFVLNYKISYEHGAPYRIVGINLDQTIDLMLRRMKRFPFKLAGPRPDAQPLNTHECIVSHRQLIGACMVVQPCDLRFDPDFPHNEDYDFFFQHLKEYGGVVANMDLLMHFWHWGNEGGVVSERDEDMGDEVLTVMQKWRDYVNPRPKPFKYTFRYAAIKRELINHDVAATSYNIRLDINLHQALIDLAEDQKETKAMSTAEALLDLIEWKERRDES